jgi:hypothetical protein
MIAFAVVMRHEVGDRMLKRGLSEEDHSVQALRLYRAHGALRERIQIRRSRRQSNEVHALTDEDVTKLVCIFCISIENQIRVLRKPASVSVILRAICVIHRLSGWGVMPAMWTEREAMSMKKRM